MTMGLRSILTPIVVRYLSEKMLLTNRDTRLVFPTAKPPSMQIFFWIMCPVTQPGGA